MVSKVNYDTFFLLDTKFIINRKPANGWFSIYDKYALL